MVPVKEQARDRAVSQFLAYFGTYSIDEKAATVTHHREGDLRADGEIDAVRRYRFEGDRLILSPVDSIQEIVWERIK